MSLKNPFRFYISRNRKAFSLGIFALLLTNIFDGLSPLILKRAVDDLTANKTTHEILPNLAVFLFLIIGTAISRYFWRIYFGRHHHAAAEDLRNRIFAKLTDLGPSFFEKRPVGQLMSLITNDVQSFRMGVGPALLMTFDSLFIMATAIPIMIYLSPQWTMKAFVVLPFLPFLVWKLERLIQSRFRTKQDKFSEVSGVAQEIISGIRVIKGYAQEKTHTQHFNKSSKEFENSSNRVSTVEAMLEPSLRVGVIVGIVILFFVGGKDVISGTVTLGTFVAFFHYIHKLSWPMVEIGYSVSMIMEARASFERISEVLNYPPDVVDSGLVTPLEFESLEFRNLSFRYPTGTIPALENVSFSISRGETLGIFGAIGSGKTTIVHLLCRLFNPTCGHIFLNGHSLETIQLSQLRNIICLVPQNVFLFGDSVASNFSLGVPDSVEQEYVEKYAKLVNIHDEIVSTSAGYNTILGERGINLSGGQKQRLSIGRGLIRNSPVVILDDVLSAVDAETERKILVNLNENVFKDRQNKTTIIISHRIVSMENCDKIVVLDAGKIVAIGSHQELVATCPFYHSVLKLQTGQPPHVKNRGAPLC
ncbi:MAG: ABC transporter ATP-binding protein [Pseudomonadota bacterium]|nr:ABC transporter ATP-binding protein [Pseudomonadota bacterium]